MLFQKNILVQFIDRFIPRNLDQAQKLYGEIKELNDCFHEANLLLNRIAVCSLFIISIDIIITITSQIFQGNFSCAILVMCALYLYYLLHLLCKLKTQPSLVFFILKLFAIYGCSKLFYFTRHYLHLLWLYFPLYGYTHLIALVLIAMESWFGQMASYFLVLYPILIIYSFFLSWNTQIVIHVSWNELSILLIHLLYTVPMIFAKVKISLTLQSLMIHMGKSVKVANAASEAKSHFISSISHDLRTPLHAIMGLITLLQTSKLDSIQETYLATMRAACNNLISIINNVLDLTRLESKKLELEVKEGDLFHILQDIADSMTPLAEEKNIELQLEISIGKDHRFLFLDQKCLSQVLNNLLGNAIKFTTKGRVLLKVQRASLCLSGDLKSSSRDNPAGMRRLSVSECALDKNYNAIIAKHHLEPNQVYSHHKVILKFSVIDTGRGISEEFLTNKLFVPFSQEDIFKNMKDSEGTGIGLSLSQKLVQKMGGEIHVKSALGKGTEITFEIAFRVANFANSEPDLSLLEVSDNGPIEVNVYAPTISESFALDIYNQLVRMIGEEVSEWQSLIEFPSIYTDSEVKNHIEKPGTHSINIIVLENSGDIFQYAVNPQCGNSVKNGPRGFHCYIFVCRLRYLRTVNESDLYKRINLDKTNSKINLTHPITPFKLHAAVKSCISHITKMVQQRKGEVIRAEGELTLSSSNLKVLVVEDNHMISQVLSKILTKHQIGHDVASNGKIAVDMWLARPGEYNIILMDVQMPVMNGFEAVSEIRRLEKEKGIATTRIIFNSAQASVEEVTRAKEVGGNAYLIKPLNYNTLMQVFHGKHPDEKEGYF